MRIIRTKDYEQMSEIAADIIANQIMLKPNCVLGLATGSTPISTYNNLVDKYQNDLISFRRVRTVNLDEYVGLRFDNPNSYFYFMKEHLFKRVNIDYNNVHFFNGTDSSFFSLYHFDDELDCLGSIDLQVLGLGKNGHIGFNEPSDEFKLTSHKVQLSKSTIEANKRFFDKEEDVPTEAYTMGVGQIMSAKTILLLVSGKEKAEILSRVIHGTTVTPQLPASILHLHPNVIVVADEDSLSEI